MVQEIMVPMRDGVRLRTKIAKSVPGSSSVIFIRGYDTDSWIDADRFVRAGYVCVSQATRGHIGSEGAHGMDNRFFDDAQDGYDALTWISQQPWCDGKIPCTVAPTTVPHSGWLRRAGTQTSKQLFQRTSILILGSVCTVTTARFNSPIPPGASTIITWRAEEKWHASGGGTGIDTYRSSPSTPSPAPRPTSSTTTTLPIPPTTIFGRQSAHGTNCTISGFPYI